MQTEELKASQADLLESWKKYADLFDFAPIGYVTIDQNDLILEANFTFSELISTDRSRLRHSRFTEFILPDDQDVFYTFKQSWSDDSKPKNRELRLMRGKTNSFWARLDCKVTEDDGTKLQKVFLSVTDITKSKFCEETITKDYQRSQILLSLFRQPTGFTKDIIAIAMEELIKLTGSKLGFIGFIDEEEIMMTTYLWSGKAMKECKIEKKPLQFSIREGGLWTAPVKIKHNVVVNDYQAPITEKRGTPAG
ncbi:MAG: PAS domain-containing protein, partial [Bacteroidia bacterium]|nr:PAS domain-containing protein [Bacteroidia bacterium]